jgi:acyl-CoA thioesterase FadM
MAEARLDDRVTIQLGKPQSKRKSFYLTQIHSRGSALVTPSTVVPGAVAPEQQESEILKQVELAEKSMGTEGFEKQERRRKEEEREQKVLEKMGI